MRVIEPREESDVARREVLALGALVLLCIGKYIDVGL
jgi:hypothetical protein